MCVRQSETDRQTAGVGEEMDSEETGVGYVLSAAAAESLQSCLTLCDPIDGGPPGSRLHLAMTGEPRGFARVTAGF